jgi:hypothetical protein
MLLTRRALGNPLTGFQNRAPARTPVEHRGLHGSLLEAVERTLR